MKKFLIVVSLSMGISSVSYAHSSADLNGDGRVDFADFLIFANAFGKEVTPESNNSENSEIPPLPTDYRNCREAAYKGLVFESIYDFLFSTGYIGFRNGSFVAIYTQIDTVDTEYNEVYLLNKRAKYKIETKRIPVKGQIGWVCGFYTRNSHHLIPVLEDRTYFGIK